MVKRRSGCLLGNEGKRQEGLLVERETTSEGLFLSLQILIFLSFSLLFCAFFKKNKKTFLCTLPASFPVWCHLGECLILSH